MKVGQMLEILKSVNPEIELTTSEYESINGIHIGFVVEGNTVAVIEFD